HPMIRQAIGNRRPGGRDHHAGVDEAGVTALLDFQRFRSAIELIDATDAVHPESRPLVVVEILEKTIERLTAEKKAAVHDGAAACLLDGLAGVDSLLQLEIVEYFAGKNAGAIEVHETIHEHLAGPVKPLAEGVQMLEPGPRGIERCNHLAINGIVAVAMNHGVDQRVTERAD